MLIDSVFTTLFFSGPPSAPGKPYLVVPSPADEPDVITVKWKYPIHDGGSKITGKTFFLNIHLDFNLIHIYILIKWKYVHGAI